MLPLPHRKWRLEALRVEANKGSRVATREGATAMLASVHAGIAALETKRNGLQPHRSLPEIEAVLKAAWLAPVVEGQRMRGTLVVVSKQRTLISAVTAEPCGKSERVCVTGKAG